MRNQRCDRPKIVVTAALADLGASIMHDLELQDFLVFHARQELCTTAPITIDCYDAIVGVDCGIRILEVPLLHFAVGDVVNPEAQAATFVLDEDPKVCGLGEVHHALFWTHQCNGQHVVLSQQDRCQIPAGTGNSVDADDAVARLDLLALVASLVPCCGKAAFDLLHNAEVLVSQVQDDAKLLVASLCHACHALLQFDHESVVRNCCRRGCKGLL
mmetsp:Transcript_784/g.1502  ORF Transcript_784/g.1502 Transcript_784/m.1502 type:complete len:215 (-) Transcript_784:138-782(-)